jgi:hypothetical protein
MKILNIYCDGGFGNRFSALIVGLLIAKLGNFKPNVLWPSTNWCRSLFHDIFDFDVKVIEKDLSYFSENFKDYEFVMHNNFLNFPTKISHPDHFNNLLSLVDFYKSSNLINIVYNNDKIPQYAECKNLYDIIHQLKFSKKITDLSNKFIQEQQLGNNFFGVHLRNTDFPNQDKPNFDKLYYHILNDNQNKYFVCSDDKDLENKFNKLENVCVYEKTKYVEKLTDEGGWREAIVDDDGKEYSFNVERSDESVQQAIIDLYILSKSNIIQTSNSSFLKTAVLINRSNN